MSASHELISYVCSCGLSSEFADDIARRMLHPPIAVFLKSQKTNSDASEFIATIKDAYLFDDEQVKSAVDRIKVLQQELFEKDQLKRHAESFLNLHTLSGSKKQIEWANDIRLKVLSGDTNLLRKYNKAAGTYSKARFWIDNRHKEDWHS